jgi:hypothetical protein
VCYFVSVGAKAPAHRLAWVFEERADLEVFASPVVSAFPDEDAVRMVTWRGCSCDLVLPSQRATKLLAAFRSCIVSVARELGSVRMMVHRHRGPCQLPAPGPRRTLTVDEFLSDRGWFVEDVVLEVARVETSSQPAFS